MLNPRAVLAVGCAGWLAACASGAPTAPQADIAKVVDVKSTFGPQFEVTEVAPTGIDPEMLASQKLPDGLTFDPKDCAQFATGQMVPPGLKGNMAAVSAEGDGNRFIAIAVETSEPVPFTDPGPNCQIVGFTGGQVRGTVKVVDAPQIEGIRTLGVHRVLQTVIDGKASTGEVYNYSAHFGNYQIIVTANPLVLPDKPVAAVDTKRAQELLAAAVAAVER
jgi:hypothetical protein